MASLFIIEVFVALLSLLSLIWPIKGSYQEQGEKMDKWVGPGDSTIFLRSTTILINLVGGLLYGNCGLMMFTFYGSYGI